ncbi:MAG: OmpA family protein [Candidatus Cloacimonadota bacterium]
MKTRLFIVVLLLLAASAAFAAYTSPDWSYGFDLGLTRGDNQGSAENIGPQARAYLQFDVFPMFMTRFGLGYNRLHASQTYTNNAVSSDLRLYFRPYRTEKFSPFIYAGYGATVDLTGRALDSAPMYPFGVGFQTNLKPGMLMEVALGYNLANTDNLDYIARGNDDNNFLSGKKQDGFYGLTVGLQFSDLGTTPQPRPVQPAPVITTPPVTQRPVTPPVTRQEPPVIQQDPRAIDTDRDGLPDVDEINTHMTSSTNPDTDGDGLNDGAEIRQHRTNPLNPDSDADGLTDAAEVVTHRTNPLDADSDGDGLSDGAEINTHRTDPMNDDSDNDGLNDGAEVNTHRTNPLLADTDGDGLSDGAEVGTHRTNPLSKDTDGGSKEDGAEVADSNDPLDPRDDVLDLRQGATFSLEGILFATGSADILPESSEILERAFTALTANPDVKVLIIGHTDNVGSAASNMSLSQRRAASVRQWLITRGISVERLSAEGRGLTQPRATNDTPEGRQLNRRIEFQIVD